MRASRSASTSTAQLLLQARCSSARSFKLIQEEFQFFDERVHSLFLRLLLLLVFFFLGVSYESQAQPLHHLQVLVVEYAFVARVLVVLHELIEAGVHNVFQVFSLEACF